MGQVSFWERALSERSFQWAWSLVFEVWTRGRGGQHLHVSMFICMSMHLSIFYLYICLCLHVCKYTHVWGAGTYVCSTETQG